MKDVDLITRIQFAALKKFGQAIFDASRAYEREVATLAAKHGIKRREIPYVGEYKRASAVATALSAPFLRQELFTDEEQAVHDRLYAALRPRVTNRDTAEAAVLAERIVSEHCAQHLAGALAGVGVAKSLALFLGAKVHRDFRQLRDHENEVVQLVERWIPSKPRGAKGRAGRRTAQGSPSKLTGIGILCELNRLVPSRPLGDLKPNTVDTQIRRIRKNAARE